MSPISVTNTVMAKTEAPAAVGPQMPLSFLKNSERGSIVRISGKEDVNKYLAELGFLPGTVIGVVNTANGNIIVDVKGSRVALDAKMASKIIVSQ